MDQRAVFIPVDWRWVSDSLSPRCGSLVYGICCTYTYAALLPSPKWTLYTSKAAALPFSGVNEALCVPTRHQRENLTREHHLAASTLDELSKDLH